MKKLELSDNCWIEFWNWDNFPSACSINYIEHATDYWSSDHESEVKIDKDLAIEIVDFLTEHVLSEEKSNLIMQLYGLKYFIEFMQEHGFLGEPAMIYARDYINRLENKIHEYE